MYNDSNKKYEIKEDDEYTDYEKGCSDMWNVFKALVFKKLDEKEFYDLFSTTDLEQIFYCFDWEEVKDIVETTLEEKRLKEFKVGDIVVSKKSSTPCVIINTYYLNSTQLTATALFKDGSIGPINLKDFRETGKNISQVNEIIDELNKL